MRINGVFLPNWLIYLIVFLLFTVIYIAFDPLNNFVNGIIGSLFGPIIEVVQMAQGLEYV